MRMVHGCIRCMDEYGAWMWWCACGASEVMISGTKKAWNSLNIHSSSTDSKRCLTHLNSDINTVQTLHKRIRCYLMWTRNELVDYSGLGGACFVEMLIKTLSHPQMKAAGDPANCTRAFVPSSTFHFLSQKIICLSLFENKQMKWLICRQPHRCIH